MDVSPAEAINGTLALCFVATGFKSTGPVTALALRLIAPSFNLHCKFTGPFSTLARKFLLPLDAPTPHFGAPRFKFTVNTSVL